MNDTLPILKFRQKPICQSKLKDRCPTVSCVPKNTDRNHPLGLQNFCLLICLIIKFYFNVVS